MATGIHSSADARRIARRRLPWMVFDYIDGAAGREIGAVHNRAAIDDLKLRPRIFAMLVTDHWRSRCLGDRRTCRSELARWACATCPPLAPT